MLKLILLFTFSFILLSLNISSQACLNVSTDPNFDEENFQTHLEKFYFPKKSNNIDRVALTIHIAESIQGQSGLTSESINSLVVKLNSYFKEAQIEFFLCGAPRLLLGDNSYNSQSATELNNQNYVRETINIYFVEAINDPNADIGGFAFFPWSLEPEDRYIILSWNFSNIAGVLAHEMGHFYGLFHTHATFFGIELADGSNCEFAGDRLCDTPADYNLVRGGINQCKYVANFQDPNGNPYMPDPQNIMSYANDVCYKTFSTQQAELMNFYHSTDNNYLISECSFPDFILTSSQKTESIRSDQDINVSYLFSKNGNIELDKIEIFFRLSDTEDEIGTIIQRDTIIVPSGSSEIELEFLVNFPINRSTNTYYLTAQVDPEFKVLEQDEGNNLHKIKITVDNSELDDKLVFANPVSNNVLKIFLRDSRNTKIDLDFYIWDHLGRLYKKVNAFKNRDEYFEEIDVSNLADGLYILEAHYPDKGRSESFNFYKQTL